VINFKKCSIFSNGLIFEWVYFASYPADGGIYWTYPIAVTTVLHLNACNVYNDTAHPDDGTTRIRTYSTTNANFTNGSISANIPIFCMLIGY